jgi:lysophospholipase L1-like esterase
MDRKRILVFGDSNSWGFVPRAATETTTTRYDNSTRWPTVMAAQLGSSIELVEEALSGRTTDLDDPQLELASPLGNGASFNGAKLLPAILASHLPLDLVIIMLGTNDLKARFKRSPQKIATAAAGLAKVINQCRGGVATAYPSPPLLLVAPPPLGTRFYDPAEWAGSYEKSLQLGSAFSEATKAAKLPFFNAGEIITTDGIDAIHLTAGTQIKLGEAIAKKVSAILQGS